MDLSSVGMGDSSFQETGGKGELSGPPEFEPELAPTSELEEGTEEKKILDPPEPQEPELFPTNESEKEKDGEKSTPSEETDSSRDNGLEESNRDDNKLSQHNETPQDRLRNMFTEVANQDTGGLDKPWNPFGNVPIKDAGESDEQFKNLKKACKEVGEFISA